MIAIVTSSPREMQLLTALCDQRAWTARGCASVNDFNKLKETVRPRVIVIRTQLRDGYSDDILASKPADQDLAFVVLAPADLSPKMEARQVDLGADCVLRDPVRIDVLVAYLRKFAGTKPPVPVPLSVSEYQFAGANVCPAERRLIQGRKSVQITRQEMTFVRLLHYSAGKVVSYSTVYDELFSRRFEGDTANARVLFGRTVASFKKIGIPLRDFVDVISKAGYLYRSGRRPLAAAVPPRQKSRR
jgi:DNA-binding response OmpR family regulator